jgi:hypothetical protein
MPLDAAFSNSPSEINTSLSTPLISENLRLIIELKSTPRVDNSSLKVLAALEGAAAGPCGETPLYTRIDRISREA